MIPREGPNAPVIRLRRRTTRQGGEASPPAPAPAPAPTTNAPNPRNTPRAPKRPPPAPTRAHLKSTWQCSPNDGDGGKAQNYLGDRGGRSNSTTDGGHDTTDWRTRFYVRPSRALADLRASRPGPPDDGAPDDSPDGDAGYGLYTAVELPANQPIVVYLGGDVGPADDGDNSDEIMRELQQRGRERHVMSMHTHKGSGLRLIDGLNVSCWVARPPSPL